MDNYIKSVLNGKQPAGKYIKLACERHKENLKDKRFYFDKIAAENVLILAQHCNHWKGANFAGKKFILEPWQKFYLSSIFGWKKTADGLRKYNTSYLEVARKNGKTTLSGISAMSHLLLDRETGSQVYFAATKEEQAKIGFEDTKNIIKGSPLVTKHFKMFQRSIMYELSTIKYLGADSRTQDGFDPSWAIVDEYHAHKNSKMLNILESGMGARAQPHTQIITTAGFDSHSPCYNLRKIGTDILEGKLKDESFFIMIFALDDEDSWDDEKCWVKANPNINVSVNLEFLRTRLNQAKNEAGTKEVDFKTKNLNLWTNSTSVWIPSELMALNYKEFDIEKYKGKKCTAGLDLAKGVDINAFVLFFDDGVIYPIFWLPENKIHKNTDGVDYELWRSKGQILSMEGDILDYEIVGNKILECIKDFDIEAIGFDKYLAYHGLIQMLLQSGYENLISVQQGFLSLSAPTKELESDLTAGKLSINNECLRWMFGNVKIEMDAAGNIKPSKAKSEKKIDGVAALINAKYVRMALKGNLKTNSIYDDESIGLIML